LGDSHDGVWNLFEEIGSTAVEQEILTGIISRESVQSWWVTQILKPQRHFFGRSARFTSALFVDLKKSLHKNRYLKKSIQDESLTTVFFSQEGFCSMVLALWDRL